MTARPLEVVTTPTAPTGPTASTGGVAVLTRAEHWLSRYVLTRSEHGPLILALWCAHTHALDWLYSTPRAIVTSAAPECGKTTLLDHLERLCAAPLLGSHATPALLARSVSAGTRTLLLDEVDNLLHARREGTPDLLAVLNSGYRRGGCRPVLVPIKDGWRTSKMPTYSAAALAGIGSGDTLPDAVLSRSLVIELDRALDGEIERTEWRDLEPEAAALAADLARVVNELAEQIEGCRPSLPDGVHGRAREVWEPLIIMAEVLGGPDYGDRAREACSALLKERTADKAAGLARRDPAESLLADLREIWEQGAEFMATPDLLHRRHRLPERPWGQIPELTPHRLARLLNRYGIKPDRLNDDARTRGYYGTPIAKAHARYVGGEPQ